MNTSPSAADITPPYQVSAARMEIDKFIVPTVTIFIGLMLCFFMLLPLSAILKLSFFEGGEFGLANYSSSKLGHSEKSKHQPDHPVAVNILEVSDEGFPMI